MHFVRRTVSSYGGRKDGTWSEYIRKSFGLEGEWIGNIK